MKGLVQTMEIQNWKEILSPYELAVDEIVLKVRHMMTEYADQGYCPIENVLGRVKSISSILAKAKKKNIPIVEITEKIEDIAGIRIICQFVEDIYKVVEDIKKRSDMTVQSEIDYIAHPKRQRIQKLSYGSHVSGTDGVSHLYHTGGNTDPDIGYEFLGCDRTFHEI